MQLPWKAPSKGLFPLRKKVTEEFGKKSRKNLEKVTEEWIMQSEGPSAYSVFFEENHKKIPTKLFE